MKCRTWRITAAEYRNPRRRFIEVVEAPAELEPQAVKEALMMRVEDYTGVPMRCVGMEEVKGNGGCDGKWIKR